MGWDRKVIKFVRRMWGSCILFLQVLSRREDRWGAEEDEIFWNDFSITFIQHFKFFLKSHRIMISKSFEIHCKIFLRILKDGTRSCFLNAFIVSDTLYKSHYVSTPSFFKQQEKKYANIHEICEIANCKSISFCFEWL